MGALVPTPAYAEVEYPDITEPIMSYFGFYVAEGSEG